MNLMMFTLGIFLTMLVLPNEVISGSLEHYIHEGCELRRIMAYEQIITTSEPFLQLVLGREFITRPMLLVKGQSHYTKHYLDFDSLMWRYTMASVKFHLFESPVKVEVHTNNLGTKTAYFEKERRDLEGTTREIQGELVWTTVGNCTSELPYEVLSQERNATGYEYRLFPNEPMEYFVISKDEQSAGRLLVRLYTKTYRICWDKELEEIRLQEKNSTDPCLNLPAFIPHHLTFELDTDKRQIKVNSQWYDAYGPVMYFYVDDGEGEYNVVYCLFKCPEENETATTNYKTPTGPSSSLTPSTTLPPRTTTRAPHEASLTPSTTLPPRTTTSAPLKAKSGGDDFQPFVLVFGLISLEALVALFQVFN